MFSLKNKKAVITGGGSGIGRAISELFAKQGAEVHIVELSKTNAIETVSGILNIGCNAYGHICKVSVH